MHVHYDCVHNGRNGTKYEYRLIMAKLLEVKTCSSPSVSSIAAILESNSLALETAGV